MANPLLQFFLRSSQVTDERGRRRGRAEPDGLVMPPEPPTTDVVFLVLRRMRTPCGCLPVLMRGRSRAMHSSLAGDALQMSPGWRG